MSLLDKITAQLPFGKKSADPEYLFALNIGLSEVTAAVWGIVGGNIDVLGQATLAYADTEELLDKACQVLDRSLGALEIEPSKILFGVPETWSLDDSLKEPYLKLLQKMLKEYDLSALAYVTTVNAISFLLQKKEGAPPTTILLGVGDFVEVTLVRGGKVVGTRVAKRDGQLFEDIEGILKQFTEVEVLPSKIQLYSTKEGEDTGKLRDELMSYPWMQRLSFLHFPKIEALDKSVAVESIIASAALEIDPQVNLKHSFSARGESDWPPTGGQRQLNREPGPEAAESGFVRGDIKESAAEETAVMEENVALPNLPAVPSPGKVLAGVEGFVAGLPKVLPKKLPRLVRGKLIIIPLVLAAIFLAYLFLVRATVTVFVEPRLLEKDAEVIADPKVSKLDEVGKIIPGTVVDTTVSGSGKATASGTKEIGDPARGKVVVYNLTSSKVSLSQGSALTSGSGLKFTLDSPVQVASQSSSVGADFTTVIKPGKSDAVGTTAAAIGPDSNLSAGTELSVNGYPKSQVIARVEDALSGGTSKNVTVVTAEDQKKLQAKVTDELRQKAQEDLQGKMKDGKKIIPEALTVESGKFSFNKGVNDTAGEFSLSATVHFKGTAFADADLRTIVSKLVETNIPEGFAMDLQDMETQADVTRVEKDGRLVFKAKFKAKLLPKLDLDDLKKQIRGQSVQGAVERLKKVENVIGGEIKFTPNLPGPFARLPLLDRNITINFAPK